MPGDISFSSLVKLLNNKTPNRSIKKLKSKRHRAQSDKRKKFSHSV